MCFCTYHASTFTHQTVLWRCRGHDKSELAAFFNKAEPGVQRPGHVSLSRLHFAVYSGHPNSLEVKVRRCQKAARPSEPTLKKPVSKWTAAFSPYPHMRNLLLSPPWLCPLFAKDRLMDQTPAGPGRLSLTSIKPSETWAQAVRLWNIHSLDTQTSVKAASLLHCAI